MNKTLRTRVHLKVSELQLPLYENHTSEFLKREDNSRDLLGKHWQDNPSRTGPRGVCFKASATNFLVPSFLSSGVLEIMMSVDSVNVFTLRSRRGRKASAISKLVVRLCRNPELQYTMASGANHSQPSVGTLWNPTMTELGSDTSRQRLARLPMTSGQFVKSLCRNAHLLHQPSQRSSWSSLDLYTIQVHSESAPTNGPNFKTGSASSELRTPKPEKKSERSQSRKL